MHSYFLNHLTVQRLMLAGALVICGFVLFGQGTTCTAQSPETEPAPAAASSTDQAWEAALDQFKAKSKNCWKLYLEIHTKTGDLSRRELEAWAKMQTELRDSMDHALSVASKRLADHPDDKDLFQFVLNSTAYRVDKDWYENTSESVRAIRAKGVDTAELSRALGLSALATGDIETAKKELKIALDANLLEPHVGTMLYYADDIEKAWQLEKERRKKDQENDDLPRVVLHTTRGDVLIELYENEAPNTVANFIKLVEDGFYDGVPFYNIVKNEFAVTGDPNGDGTGDAGYHIKDEYQDPNARAVFRGSLIMAKLPNPGAEHDPEAPYTLPDSASCQFFISFLPMHGTLHGYTSFGRVIEGIGAVCTMNRVTAKKEKGEIQRVPDQIITAEVVRKRDHSYEPEVILPTELEP